MASERFLNLNEEKKKRILEAAREEFSSVPFEAVSINKIIQNAGISRGSFYTYFESKRDLLNELHRDDEENSQTFLKELIIKNHGDYWTALRQWLDFVVSYRESARMKQSLGIIMNTAVSLNLIFNKDTRPAFPGHQSHRSMLSWLRENLDPQKVDVSGTEEEFAAVIKMTFGMTVMMVAHILMNPDKQEELLRQYELSMKYMKMGASPEMRSGNQS